MQPALGWIEAHLQEELPGLGLHYVAGHVKGGRSPKEVREQLDSLATRLRGARAISLRTEAVPAAHRVFFSQIGLDPEVVRTPIEAAVIERLTHGGIASAGLVADALRIAVLETAVAVWALDRATTDGPLGIRTARPSEAPYEQGELVIADASRPLGRLFGEIEPPAGGELVLFAVQVPGVGDMNIHEALWLCVEVLEMRC